MRKILAFLSFILLGLILLSGCGGGGGQSSSSGASNSEEPGLLAVSIAWPTPQKASAKFIPDTTAQITLNINSGEQLRTYSNPGASGQVQETIQLAPGNKQAEIKALSSSGAILAHRICSFVIQSKQTTSLTAELGVTIQDSGFTPQSITVPAGTTLLWVNNGSQTHSLNGSAPFDGASIPPDGSISYTFSSAGSFSYSDGSLMGTVVVTAPLTVPSAPTGVTATAGDGQVTTTWDAVTDATSYNIYWSTTSGVTKTSGTKITDATSPYSHTERTNGTPYYYVVTAVNSYGESSESSQVSAIPTSGDVVSSILDNATFYNGPRPVPTNITFVDSYDNQVTMFGYPGQVNVVVTPRTEISTVKSLVEQHGGAILSQIPVLGLYLVQVPVGSEASFISAVRQNPIVQYASPNSVLIPKTSFAVDLSDTGVTDPSELVVALINSPDPSAKVILVQVEDYKGNHGDIVEQEMNLITGPKDKLKVNVALQPSEGLPFELRSQGYYTNGDVLNQGMTAAIAGAELNNQKAVINLSYGPIYQTDEEDKYNNNTLVLNAIEVVYRGMLLTLANSDWAKEGNIFLSVAVGNEDAILVDKNGEYLKSRTLDYTSVFNHLKADPVLGPVMKYVIFCGALDSTGKLAEYSSYGDEVIYGYPHYAEGSSYVAPQCSGAVYNAWSTYPNLNSEQIKQALQTAANKHLSDFNYPVLDVEGTITEAGSPIPTPTPILVETYVGTMNYRETCATDRGPGWAPNPEIEINTGGPANVTIQVQGSLLNPAPFSGTMHIGGYTWTHTEPTVTHTYESGATYTYPGDSATYEVSGWDEDIYGTGDTANPIFENFNKNFFHTTFSTTSSIYVEPVTGTVTLTINVVETFWNITTEAGNTVYYNSTCTYDYHLTRQ